MKKLTTLGLALAAAIAFAGTAQAQIKMGVAGEQYFEVLSGLKAGDQVITGPFASVRSMSDGDAVRIETTRVREIRK